MANEDGGLALETPTREIAQISFHLAIEGTDFDTVVDLDSSETKKEELQIEDFEYDGVPCRFIYFKTASRRTTPPWLAFINERLPIEAPIQFADTSRNPNGVLLLQIDGRVLAAAFGRAAASCLKKKEMVPDFGIKTAMNMCGNEEIRQTRSQSNAITPTHIDRQVSRPSDTFVFGLSDAEDLRYISAHLKGDRNVTLQGRDHLTVKVIGSEKLTWERLINRCGDFLERYEARDYIELFPNYRNFQPASDDEIIVLDAALIVALKARDFAKIDLTIPEFLQEDEFSFSFTNHAKKENKIYAFLSPTQLEEQFKNLNDLKVEKLHARRIFAYSAAEDRVLRHRYWSIYDCLVFEHEHDGEYFLLSSGRWTKVDPEFHQSIVKFIMHQVREEPAEAAYCNIDISDDTAKRNSEAIFNEKVVALRPSSILFDRAKLKIGTGRKDKEFCDILDLADDGRMRIINVKQHKDASSINYLFSQAKFYCEAFLNDDIFLAEIRGHIDASPSPRKTDYLAYIKDDIAENHGQNYRLCLWLLYDAKLAAPTKTDIPLIAQYELKLMHDHLRKICKLETIILRFVPVAVKRYTTGKRPNSA